MTFRTALTSFCFLGALLVATYVVDPFKASNFSIICRLYGLCAFRVPAASMEPTIHSGGWIWASAWPYQWRSPMLGDIVVFRFPPNPSILYVKRIVAVGGQNLQIRKCRLLLNGIEVKEAYVDAARVTKPDSCDTQAFEVPIGQYMVLGDNRDNSYDSRYWGFLPRRSIIGRVLR